MLLKHAARWANQPKAYNFPWPGEIAMVDHQPKPAASNQEKRI
jgi:hypothetical protein